MWREFISTCHKPMQFIAHCNMWRSAAVAGTDDAPPLITIKQLEAFDAIFSRGLMAASRNDLVHTFNPWPTKYLNISCAEVITLLLQHGANPLERDIRGATLLHWAAGTGNLEGVQKLLPFFDQHVFSELERDGSTPLHWAAAGADARKFGIGGYPDVCRYLLEQVEGDEKKDLVNRLTKDGNSVLMWAAWSGSEEVVKMMIRNRADPFVANRNGCTVAHWGAAGGNLPLCKYLAETVGVDFTAPNHGGNTPLTHAVADGRVEIVEWLSNEVCNIQEDSIAASLAKDFVDWGGDDRRKQVLSLFEDWYGRGDDDSDAQLEKAGSQETELDSLF
eukprot:CAMPEP_0116858562 /NCGR_PEP_ID=MMETSP0418-20121206/21255_1 /TAXON_ID=1158023 /ORGANISM="Astrosyne radiata, Strain 13vi08-1A" /LENGTH=332 /DNA_ID=CAMNT_0004492525 /DNA_START=14 /DNA_END=1012 /DNA_ORIENTATION=+